MTLKWNEMSPRERDALVAEKVIGWKWRDYEWYDGSMKKVLVCDGWEPSGDDFDCLLDNPNLLLFWDMPHYTTDISAAWQVLLKMRDKGYDMVLVVGIDYVEATFYPQQSAQYSSRIVDDSAPEAVCKAALKAVGVNVD